MIRNGSFIQYNIRFRVHRLQFIGKALRAAMSQWQRDTFVLHNGQDHIVLQELQGHSLRKDCIPSDLGK